MINMFNLDVSIMTVSIVIALIGACYAVLGGLRAVIYTDMIQTFILLAGTIAGRAGQPLDRLA